MNEWKKYGLNKARSKEYAKADLDLDIALLLNDTEKIELAAKKKHEYVLNYIAEKCSNTIDKFKNDDITYDLLAPQDEIKVWSMWLQGEENADKLFRMCIDSARRHTGQEVIVLSKDNYDQYFSIPEYILEKHKDGKIAVQHICDLMVVSILAAQGGFFTGATVWWSQDVGEDFLKTPFFTCKAESKSNLFMSRSRWVGYVLAGNKDFPLFSFARECLLEYWCKCDFAIDYLMLDYIFELAYQNIPVVKKTIDELPDNNLLRNELINKLSDAYDENKFRRYTQGDTFMYKLSWKFGEKKLITADGYETNYAHMLSECGSLE